MKKQLRSVVVLLFATSTIIFNGCKKGEDGAPEKDDSSNVTAYTYSVSSWLYSSPAWYKSLSVPELTSANINSASVQTYLLTATNTWTALPNTFYNSGGSNYLMGFETTVGSVKVTWIYNNLTSQGSDPDVYFGTSSSQFKVVIIPPAMITANPDLNFKNYNEVKTRFNLKD